MAAEEQHITVYSFQKEEKRTYGVNVYVFYTDTQRDLSQRPGYYLIW